MAPTHLGNIASTSDDGATQQVASVLAAGSAPADISSCEWEKFVTTYLAHQTDTELPLVDPLQVANQISSHFALGRTLKAQSDLVTVQFSSTEVQPSDFDQESTLVPPGSALIQIVTDDRPFLIDTVVMEIRRQNWTLTRLEHPQFRVKRIAGEFERLVNDDDNLEDFTQESWVSLVGYPPLTSNPEIAATELLTGLRSSLESVRLVVDDWQAMVSRCEDASNSLDEADWVDEEQVRSARDLLAWLAAGHFIFLGYQEYRFDDQGFTPVAGTGLGVHRGNPSPPSLTGFHAFPVEDPPRVLVMTKHPYRATVHRPAYMDYLGIRSYDAAGRLLGERRFLGLLSASAYAEAVSNIPVLAAKSAKMLKDSGYEPESFGAISIANIISNYPRDELFDADIEELAPVVTAIESLRDHRVVRVFMRRDRYGQFMTNLIYLPRDRYDTTSRQRICEILQETCGGESFEYTARASEVVLAQLFVVVKLRPDAPEYVEDAYVQKLVEQATHTWEDDFTTAVAAFPPQRRAVNFGEAYQSTYSVSQAVADLQTANDLTDDGRLCYSLTPAESSPEALGARLKIFSKQRLELARIMPHLTSFGVEVLDEMPFEWQLRGEEIYLYDIGLRMPFGWEDDWNEIAERLVSAFDASYRGLSEADAFNRLVLSANLTWVEVSWLRSISRFIKQVKQQYSQNYIANALMANGKTTSLLVQAIRTKFDPAMAFVSMKERSEQVATLLAQALSLIDEVNSLDHDRILRQFVLFVDVTVRTNAFTDSPTLAWKIDSSRCDLLPEPRPWKEIFVYSPRVQGVHLRFGPVARGGLRWSDRPEDFRTEILGLVKAQTVKNTVIVPVGAKGGFVPLQLPDPTAGNAAWLAEGKACYQLFISALLSLTDNIVDGEVVLDTNVLRYDADDPYLVVAADKGTAKFSDVANEISLTSGFWLGDAFASGGSVGYDHKAMGITARGAWESVKWHFAQLGIDIASEFTCVGIGDMSGDVFGNGMLLSDKIRLLAAFDHRHIFLDPNPDAASSFTERQRLFELPRSSWADYDMTRISAGGGVYSRLAKQIPISREVAQALGLNQGIKALAPDELVSAILKASVDLLWNGGIGTYVKAESENNIDVGDKANDAVRVNGTQVRARVAVEGGNLGWTQLGRIEYARNGGAINTDFIDNSAGVDTSDFEVNIKILLAGEAAAGRLGESDRRELLASMTDDIATSVLRHNVAQNAALSNAEARAVEMAGRHNSWMRELEDAGFLDRSLEALPSSAELERRVAIGAGLSRPELAVLLAYTKIAIKEWVLQTDLPEDPYLTDRLQEYFPAALREAYPEQMANHRLAREIITTVAVNRFVDSQGSTAFFRLSSETGASISDIMRAQLAARSIYKVGRLEVMLSRMSELSAPVVTDLRMELRRLVERAARWLLHNRRTPLDVKSANAEFTQGVILVQQSLRQLLTSSQLEQAGESYNEWVSKGVPAELAEWMCVARYAHFSLSIVQTARHFNVDPVQVAAIHFRLAEIFALDRLDTQIYLLPRQERWDAMARGAVRDESQSAHAELTAQLVGRASEESLADPEALLESWLLENPGSEAKAELIAQICEGNTDLARATVGLRTLRGLL